MTQPNSLFPDRKYATNIFTSSVLESQEKIQLEVRLAESMLQPPEDPEGGKAGRLFFSGSIIFCDQCFYPGAAPLPATVTATRTNDPVYLLHRSGTGLYCRNETFTGDTFAYTDLFILQQPLFHYIF
jgi:hypothetical protein